MSAVADLFWDDKAADVIVSDSIECIYSNFLNRLEELEMEKQEIPFATGLAMAKLDVLINIATLEYDGSINLDQIFEKFEADGEPYPSSIDSWARGIVPTRKVAAEDSGFKRNIPASQSSTPSVSSFRSSATGKSRNTMGARSYRSSQSKQQDRLDKTGQIIELDNEVDAEFVDLSATGLMFNMLQKQKKNRSQGYFESVEGVKGEFELLQDQLSKAAKDVRGKKFTLDRYGQPVIIGKVDPNSLPSFTTSLYHSVKAEEDIPKGRNDPFDEANAANKQKKKQFIRVAGSRGVEENSFQPTLSLATSLSGVESIPKINAGITIKSKSAVKSGDAVQEDPKHMSKKTYLSKTINVVPASNNEEFLSQYSSQKQVSGMKSKQNQKSDKVAAKATVVNEAFLKNIESLPDIDALEGSRSVVFEEKTFDPSDDELGLGPTKSIGRTLKAVLPNKPTPQQRANIDLLSGSSDNGKPRDRDMPMNMKSAAQKKHLPPPPLGFSTGHGILPGDNRQSSMFSNSIDSSSYSSQWFSNRQK